MNRLGAAHVGFCSTRGSLSADHHLDITELGYLAAHKAARHPQEASIPKKQVGDREITRVKIR